MLKRREKRNEFPILARFTFAISLWGSKCKEQVQQRHDIEGREEELENSRRMGMAT